MITEIFRGGGFAAMRHAGDVGTYRKCVVVGRGGKYE